MSDETQEAQASSLSVIEQQERANIDLLVATAKKYPRDIVRVKRNMEATATIDEETAESCNYHLERNGKAIDGPSVRMAEIAVAAYQNIRCGSRVIANDGKVITGQAFCHDLENNTFIAWETQRRITDKEGRTYSEDMQVLTGNAASAIAFRNAVFKIIPGALIKSVAEKARAVAVGDLKTLAQRRTRALNKFASLGINQERVLAFLSRANIEQIDIADVETLFGVFTAIREGTTTIEEQFPPAAPKVVKPNFGGEGASPASVARPEVASSRASVESPPPRRRGRPPKQQQQAPAAPPERVGPQSPPEPTPEPAPEEPEPEPEPAAAVAQTPPAPSTQARQGSLFGEKVSTPPSDDPRAQIARKLLAANISHEKFLHLLLDNELIECERHEITMGSYDLGSVDPNVLILALRDWNRVLDVIKDQAK